MPAANSETSAEALARLYDLDLAEDPGDVELYRALARRTGGPIVELAVGTGRIAAPLAADGHQVVGVDIDVVDPGSAPGTGTPEPGGMLPRELLRAIRRIVGRVELAGMDIVEVSPPYDWAESTAMLANRCALEAISALAVKRRAGNAVRFAGLVGTKRGAAARR